MFASLFNMLYPSKTFLTSVLNILHYSPSTYDIEELNNQMNQKEECDLLDGSIDVSEINKMIPLKKFLIQNILIKKTNFVFKRNFSTEKTKLFFEDIIIDIYHKIKEENKNINKGDGEEKKEEKKDSAGGFLNSVINVVIQNLEVGFKNITIKIYDKENKAIVYTLFIKNISFKEASDFEPIKTVDKGKYLFIHNKAVYIEKILFKEKFEENDQIFFENMENADWFNNYLKNNNCIFYLGEEVELDIFHDKDNAILTISNINESKLNLEIIFIIEQMRKLYYYFIKKEDDEEKGEIKKVEKTKKDIDIMGFKIKKINIELKIDLFYLILFEENKAEKIKEKKWVSLEENLIEEEQLKNGIDTNNKIIERFNTYKTKYYVFCLNNILFKLNKKLVSIDNISLNLINSDNIINDEKKNYEIKNLIQITKFNFDNEKKEIIYDNIYLEINNIFISLFKLMIDNFSDNKQALNDNNNIIKNDNIINPEENIKENKIDINKENNIISTKEEEINNIKEEKKTYKINGQNLTIKMFCDKNIEETVDKMSLNDIFNDQKYSFYINFVINDININENIVYDKFELTYNDIENKAVYPICNLLDKLKKSQIIKEKNDEITINLDFELYFFINPKIIKPILDYLRSFASFIPKKEKIQINNDIEINSSKNLLFNCDLNLNININAIKVILIENQKNIEEENIINNNNDENNLPQNEIIYNDKNNNNICFNLNKMSFKIEKNKDFAKLNFIMKSLIIQDNLYNSKYKIILSNYDFKNENEIFINCDLNMILNNAIKKYEIKPKVKIAPLAVYLDQVTLYYILNIFRQITEKENEDKKDINNINNDNINFVNNNDNRKYVISNIEVYNFFIELNYNTNKASAEEYKLIADKITSYLNTTSINKLKIIFQKYQSEENSYLSLKESIKKIYEFYSNDMIKQISGSLVSALPLFYPLYDSIDGAFDIIREPLDNYNKNESVADGFVKGVNSWVVKTATMFTYLGESIGNMFSFKGCVGDKDEDYLNKENFSTCRQLRHLFNEDNREKEEYYLKW